MTKQKLYAAKYVDTNLDSGYKRLFAQVDAIMDLMKKLWGEEYISEAIEKEGLGEDFESTCIEDRIHALQRLVLKEEAYIDDPIFVLEKIEKELSIIIARRHIENRIEMEVEKLLEEKQDKLIDELKLSIIKKQNGPENSKTLNKLANLQKLDGIKLSKSIMELLRPSNLDEIIGQERAVSAIISKIASPYPQHIILYGPPGVGKTSAARLALSIAKNMKSTPFRNDAPFVEVDGTTLRWDPREITNPLLGSVHDPIYQGSKKDFAEIGVPEPKPGLVTDAHGGVLFIDEIGEMDPVLQNKLLKVLEDKRVDFSSSYYDPDDENVPAYIKKLFEDGAPADFILIGATTREPYEINAALRSRCAEVYFEPLTKKDIQKIVLNASKKLKITIDEDAVETISEYTIEGRKAVNILADVYGYVIYKRGEENVHITREDVYAVASLARLTPYSKKYASNNKEVGKVFGLGVSGFLGSILEIEAVAFERQSEGGTIRFNDTAGSMAKDSVFNAGTVIRSITGKDVSTYDVHVNIVGGGNVDGPSAGVAITIAILSAITKKPVRQDVAITGEISLLGHIKPVGGVMEKVYGAIQGGIKTVLIPEENKNDLPENLEDIEIIPVSNINEVIDIVF
ncbi:ATP-dependent Lon protease [Fonticella tunisiensis]|uniref:endopeptidase La n=1 Tax=Fonticella tunisiensis TaxID=1096341 RepID=A0A4R7KCP9_9CLOT|nr:Lon family ATP-dependent protease [Fonticella tunisiensis]TDT50466.1 ATP-dependent Lon protease [Fonticella tunisiensis]